MDSSMKLDQSIWHQMASMGRVVFIRMHNAYADDPILARGSRIHRRRWRNRLFREAVRAFEDIDPKR